MTSPTYVNLDGMNGFTFANTQLSSLTKKEELCRCLGPTKNEGNQMCQWILQQNGQIVPRRTLRRLRPIDLSVTNEAEATNCAQFDAAIKKDLGDSITPAPIKQKQSIDPMNNFDYDELDQDDYENVVPEADAVDARGSYINKQSVADLLINAEVLLPQGEAQQMAKVVR